MTSQRRPDPHLYVNLLLTALARGHAASVDERTRGDHDRHRTRVILEKRFVSLPR
jgi:hypothetical protein